MTLTLRVHETETGLTAHDLLHYYCEAYEKLHQQAAHCEYIGANQFMVNNSRRDVHWLGLEIELLHQRLLTTSMEGDSADYLAIRKIVRRFQSAMKAAG